MRVKEPIGKDQLRTVRAGNGKVTFDPSNPQEVAAVSEALEQIEHTEGEQERHTIIQKLLVRLETFRY